MSDATISLESLQIFLDILADHSRNQYDAVHISDGIRWFQGAAHDLENRLKSGDLPRHLHDDLRLVAEVFRNVGKGV